MDIREDEFRCPRCGERLIRADGLACRACGATYPVRDGIIDFRVHDRSYYFNPVPREAMRSLTQDMEHDDWATTVVRFLRHVGHNPDWLDNLTADGRYAWKVLLNLSPETVLLDLGCGLGSAAHNLAPHLGRVYAMDLTYERVEFALQRLRSANPRQAITAIAGGDGDHLPFPDGAVDCVVLSGVLEWVGEGDLARFEPGSKPARALRMALSCLGPQSPRAIQGRFLAEIRRVLKPEGQLFIAIENRLNYEYFTGRRDHHSALRFGSLLPRFVANLYSICAARRPYRTYTYSIRGYRRLLRGAGFSHLEFFALAPGYSHLREIFPVQAGPRWRPRPARTLRERVTRSRYLVPAYGIVASAAPAPRLADLLIRRVEADLGAQLGGTMAITEYLVSAKDKGLMMGVFGTTPVVVRLPFNGPALEGETRNAESLRSAKATFAKTLRYVPRSLTQGSVGPLHYFVEDRLPGMPIKHLLRARGRTAYLQEIEGVLTDLHPTPAATAEALVDGFYDAQVRRRLKALFGVIPDPAAQEALARYFHDHLHGAKLPRGVHHGDFGVHNIFIDAGRVSGLIDWELSALDGLPILDLLAYLDSVQRLFTPAHSIAETVALLTSMQWPVAEERELLARAYERLRIDPSYHEPLVYLFWLHHVTGQLAFGLRYDEPRFARNVESVVRRLVAACGQWREGAALRAEGGADTSLGDTGR